MLQRKVKKTMVSCDFLEHRTALLRRRVSGEDRLTDTHRGPQPLSPAHVSIPQDSTARALSEGPARLLGVVRVKWEDNIVSVGFYSGALGQWLFFHFNYKKSEKRNRCLAPRLGSTHEYNREWGQIRENGF